MKTNILPWILIPALTLLSLACGGGSSGSSSSSSETTEQSSEPLTKISWNSSDVFDVQPEDTISVQQGTKITLLNPSDDLSELNPNTPATLSLIRKGITLFSTVISAEELSDASQNGTLSLNEANGLSSFLSLVENQDASNLLNKSSLGVSFWVDVPSASKATLAYLEPTRLNETFGPMTQRINLLALFVEVIDAIDSDLSDQDIQALNTLRVQILTERTPLNLYNAIHSPSLPSEFIKRLSQVESLSVKGSDWLENEHGIDLATMKHVIFNDKDAFIEAFAWPGVIIQGVLQGAISSEITVWAQGNMVTSTTTDALGRYTLEVPVPGSILVQPSKDGYIFQPEMLMTSLEHGRSKSDANFDVYQLGSLTVPPPGSVLYGIEYTSSDGQTKLKGSFKPISGANIESFIFRSAGAIEFSLIDGSTVSGQFVLPDESEVQAGVDFGLYGATYTGTYVGSGGSSNVPSSSDVISGILYMETDGSSVSGTYVKASPPSPSHVLSGISYTTSDGSGTTVNGTLSMPSENLVFNSLSYTSDDGSIVLGKAVAPSANQVMTGVTFSNNLGGMDDGLLVLPSTGQVESGVDYGPSGSYKGTLSKASTSSANYSGNISIDSNGFAVISGSTNILGVLYPESTTAGDGQVMVYNASGGNLYFADAFDGSNASITGGNIDGTDIGSSTPASGNFTTLSSSSSLVAEGSANLMGLMYPNADGSANQILATQGNGHLAFMTISSPITTSANYSGNISIDSNGFAVISGSTNILGVLYPESTTAGDGQVMVYNASGGNLYFADAFDGSNVTITGGNIDGTDIGSSTPASGNFSSLSSSSSLIAEGSANLLGLMHPSVDGSANQFLATQGNGHLIFMSSNVILNNSSVSSLSVDGGSLENVTIGSSTPTTAGFTTITGTSMTLSDNLIVSDNLLVSRDTVLGTSSTNLLTINATVQGGSAGGNVWFEGNLISSSNTYSLGIATKAWSAIYAIKLVTTSDQRAKKDIEPLEYGLDELLKLNPVSYEWKDRPNPKRTIGLIAQEVSEVMDEVVVGDVKKDERIGLEYHTLVPVLIQAIKEQQGIIEAQKVDLHTQDQRANQQEARLKRLEKLIGIETPRSE